MKELVILPTISVHSEKSLGCYFTDLKKLAMIDNEEEIALAKRIKNGDDTAVTQLVKANLRFVISVAKQYQHQGVALGDLINEGNIGLISAAKKFDETKGYKFLSYAVWWIRQAIIFAIAEQARLVHIPYNLICLKSKVGKAVQKLEQKLARSPSYNEIAAFVNVDEEKIRDLYQHDKKQLYVDGFLNTDSDTTYLEVLQCQDYPADSTAIAGSLRQTLLYALEILSPRDRKILHYHFGLSATFPMTLEDIALNIGLSIEHTRRTKDLALEKLKNSSYGAVLQLYLS